MNSEMPQTELNRAQIGIIGGSGFYDFLQGKEVSVSTPYGQPSDKILLTEFQGKDIAFLPRHGKGHQYPPHKINYRANLFALKQLGVKQVLAPCAVGSLRPEIEPGHFVIADQFIAKTKARKDTFFDGPDGLLGDGTHFSRVAHIVLAEPYCPALRDLAIKCCGDLNIAYHKQGTVLVIEGPRFSTKAESRHYSGIADIINMTQYPEVALARELEMCYLNISLVTDYDAGLKDRTDVKPVTIQEVTTVFKQNNEKVKKLILQIIDKMPTSSPCLCNQALKHAFL